MEETNDTSVIKNFLYFSVDLLLLCYISNYISLCTKLTIQISLCTNKLTHIWCTVFVEIVNLWFSHCYLWIYSDLFLQMKNCMYSLISLILYINNKFIFSYHFFVSPIHNKKHNSVSSSDLQIFMTNLSDHTYANNLHSFV